MATAIRQNISLVPIRRGIALFGPIVAFLFFYMIAFPKGGVRVGSIPVTFGYLLSVPLLLATMLRARSLALPLDRLLAFLPCLLLGMWSVLVVRINGTDSVGFTFAYLLSVFYLPIFGMTVFSALILDGHHGRMERALLWAVRFIVIYGIILFLFKQATGQWIEIPYLTVNAGDVGELDDKFINRGGIFKLISTYNNGNIFGICAIIMGPLYLHLENRKLCRLLFYVALFLTLSRTAWIGAILILGLRSLSRGVRPLAILYLAAGLVVVGSAIFFLLGFLGRDMSFIFDSNLGGRAEQLTVLDRVQVVPDVTVSALPEIVYLGVLKYFGIPGLILFILHLLVPPLLLWLEGTRLLSMSPASACFHGLLIYSVIAGADAAYSLIPVMMIFWMVAGFGFWYARRQMELMRTMRAPAY